MCTGVAQATQFGTYELKEDARILVYTGRSTFQPGVEAYYFTGMSSPGDDGAFPKRFCEFSDAKNTQGQARVHGFARFYVMWELVLCRPWTYLKSISNSTYGGYLDISIATGLSSAVDLKPAFEFDWSSLILLQDKFHPQPDHRIFARYEIVDYWQPTPEQLFKFRRAYNATIFNFANDRWDLREKQTISSIERWVESTVQHYAPYLRYLTRPTSNRYSKSTILRVIRSFFIPFGTLNSTSQMERVEKCTLFSKPVVNSSLIDPRRRERIRTLMDSIERVIQHLCMSLSSFLVSSYKGSAEDILVKLKQVKYEMHWSEMEECSDACPRSQRCLIGYPNPMARTFNTCSNMFPFDKNDPPICYAAIKYGGKVSVKL